MVYLRRRPFLLNHKINIACDCRCKFCNSWQIEEDPQLLLSRAEIEGLLDRAAGLGMLSYSVWGGEPLLREDAPAILAHARKRGFFTTLSTNASRLTERAAEFIPHTSLFLVSLDGIGKTHDHIRGCPGLFEKAVAGIELLRRERARVRLYYNVNRQTLDDVRRAAELARELKVSIFFFPALRFPGYNDDLVLEREAEKKIFAEIMALKAAGFPVANLKSYLRVIRDDEKLQCRFPQYHIYVDYEGTIYTCDLGPDRKLAVWGNAKTADLAALFASEEWKRKTRELADCNACRLSCGEIGAGSPLSQFPVRAWTRITQEWLR
jgi:MoaA/NifB/PqqE/SkfB family radical SAM enzyme